VSPRRTLASTILVASSVLFSGCLGSAEPEETSKAAWGAEALSLATYYTARIDVRRCAFPRCGGVFVSAVNQDLTVCADGTVAPECYVAELDTSGVSPARVNVRDAIGTRRETTRVVLFGDLGVGRTGLGSLFVRMAWIAPKSTRLRGDFFRVVNNGVVCVAAPCPSYDEEYLNFGVAMPIHGYLLTEAPGSTEDEEKAFMATVSTQGLLVAGTNVLVQDAGPAGPGIFVQASQYFLPLAMRTRR